VIDTWPVDVLQWSLLLIVPNELITVAPVTVKNLQRPIPCEVIVLLLLKNICIIFSAAFVGSSITRCNLSSYLCRTVSPVPAVTQ